MARLFALGLVALFGAAAARAEPPAMAAVGVLSLSDRSACTATLIEADLVLTAAHCVLQALDRTADVPVGFRTGSYPGYPAHREVVQDLAVHPFYLAQSGASEARLRYDLALARLAAPVPEGAARPVPVGEVLGDEAPIVASYRGGAPARARERRCPLVLGTEASLSLACDVRMGESGSPVLVEVDGRLSLVAVVSASGRMLRTEIALAPRAAPGLGVLRALLVPR
ncbi:trypsin-like serine peptidase [Roseitranquillus sediminis]|uniref:trypsin-like serine peptidase n=1 Tax=Roseitranquillus sediminis TaxID=2809051 RepID=UPI001D0C6F14|nr:trypsin-like serine protease [Roseitranquillus sediminis]MBM9594854.1 trypsin-like serine protease [Roseitranquillus sediminis]